VRNQSAAIAVGMREDLSLSVYMKEISAIPLLTIEEERKLGRRIRTRRDKKSLDRLVISNLRFVVHLAKNYVNRGLSLADIIHEGNLGLIRAANAFDERRGVRFISYAQWWIRQCILLAIARQVRMIRLPMNKEGMLHKVHKLGVRMRDRLGREPTYSEIAEEMDVPERELIETMNLASFHLSLYATEGADGEQSLSNLIPEESVPPPDDRLIDEGLRWDVRRAVHLLTPREARILELYFGIDCERTHTLEEIGELHGLSKERVRQIKERALQRLLRCADAKKLYTYLN
jgi:RNA polymerase primary sigma factor